MSSTCRCLLVGRKAAPDIPLSFWWTGIAADWLGRAVPTGVAVSEPLLPMLHPAPLAGGRKNTVTHLKKRVRHGGQQTEYLALHKIAEHHRAYPVSRLATKTSPRSPGD